MREIGTRSRFCGGLNEHASPNSCLFALYPEDSDRERVIIWAPVFEAPAGRHLHIQGAESDTNDPRWAEPKYFRQTGRNSNMLR